MQLIFCKGFLFLILFFCCNAAQAKTDTLHFMGLKPKSGDTIHFISIFNQFDWDVKMYKDNKELSHYQKCKPDTLDSDTADKIKLTTTFEIDSHLLNKTFVFRYVNEGSLLIKVNGKEIIKTVKSFKTKRFVLFEEEEEGYGYFTFPEKTVTIEIIITNSDISEAIEGKFEIGELSRKDEKTASEYLDIKISILLLFFYLAIGLVLLILYLFHKKSIENFYFSFFCILFSLSLVSDLFHFSSFVTSLFSSLSAYSLAFLATYLSIILIDKVRSKKSLIIFSIILVVLIIFQTVFQYYKISSLITFASIFYLVYNFFAGIYLLFQGSNKKKWEARFIKYGFFSALFFIFGIFIIITIIIIIITKNNLNSGSTHISISGFFEGSRIIGLIIIPLTIAIIIGKRNGLNQQELILQLSEIKTLSDQNIEKEKEKQAILSLQNVVLEEKVKRRTSELQHEKEIVEIKNREILDSIEYALRIQTAILPPSRIVKQYLINSFIFYRPKDIVAGDFYWMETVGDLVLFAACDCTGHGVSGAMVSLVCHNALNRAVREFNLIQPASILNKTTEIVIENFAKSEDEIKDGMDISLCAYNIKTKTLEWAGANNPLWQIQNGKLIETKANKQSIGMDENNHPFTNHQFTLQTGDSIYIFSDGFADQFGGENGDTKLTRKHFKELIHSIQDTDMQEQGNALEKFILNYRKDVEQIDDILVMGVKV